MKTTIISIPPVSASETLKSLHESNIPCKYVGIDQDGRILMELRSGKDQENLIRELILNMEKAEKFMKELQQVFNETIKKMTDEADKKWDDIMAAVRQKRKERPVTI